MGILICDHKRIYVLLCLYSMIRRIHVLKSEARIWLSSLYRAIKFWLGSCFKGFLVSGAICLQMRLLSQRINFSSLNSFGGFCRQAVDRKGLLYSLFINFKHSVFVFQISHRKIRSMKASCLNFLTLKLIKYAPVGSTYFSTFILMNLKLNVLALIERTCFLGCHGLAAHLCCSCLSIITGCTRHYLCIYRIHF